MHHSEIGLVLMPQPFTSYPYLWLFSSEHFKPSYCQKLHVGLSVVESHQVYMSRRRNVYNTACPHLDDARPLDVATSHVKRFHQTWNSCMPNTHFPGMIDANDSRELFVSWVSLKSRRSKIRQAKRSKYVFHCMASDQFLRPLRLLLVSLLLMHCDIIDSLNIIDLLIMNNDAQLSPSFFISGEKTIHFFKRQTLRLRKEEVDDWNPCCVKHLL